MLRQDPLDIHFECNVGFISLVRFLQWQAHSLPGGVAIQAWIAAFNPHSRTTIISGGDDSCLKLWDIRSDSTRSPVVVYRTDAGVTGAEWHPTDEHTFATGGYDDIVRVWDDRSMKSPVQLLDVGGGVWRLKWYPPALIAANTLLRDCLLVAAMRGGVHVVQAACTDGRALVNADLLTLYQYSGHEAESLVYGVDWLSSADNCEFMAASCSFYDNKLSLWRCRRLA